MCGLTGTACRHVGPIDHVDVDGLGCVGHLEYRVRVPVDTLHIALIEPYLFEERPADSLNDVAFDRGPQTFRVDDQAAIVGDEEPSRPDAAR